MRRFKILAVALVVVGVTASIAGAIVDLPYSDDFDDGDSAGWQVISGDWSVVDGEYHQTLIDDNGGVTPWGDEMISLMSGGPSDAYRVDVDVLLIDIDPEIGWWGITFRYEDPSSWEYIGFGILPNGPIRFPALEYWSYDDVGEPGGYDWGDWVGVSLGDTDWDPYQWHRLGVVVNGTHLEFYLDGLLAFEATDTTGFTGGSVGLYTEWASVAFDNWEYRSLTPAEVIEDLVAGVSDLNLDNGISNSLDAKLDNALEALDDINENNDASAINRLEAFINAVEAQAGNKIPQADAEALIAAAQRIIDLLTG